MFVLSALAVQITAYNSTWSIDDIFPDGYGNIIMQGLNQCEIDCKQVEL